MHTDSIRECNVAERIQKIHKNTNIYKQMY